VYADLLLFGDSEAKSDGLRGTPYVKLEKKKKLLQGTITTRGGFIDFRNENLLKIKFTHD